MAKNEQPMRHFTITESPYPMDDDFPWIYDEVGLANWYWEVFQECAEDAPGLPTDEIVGSLVLMGYVVEETDAF